MLLLGNATMLTEIATGVGERQSIVTCGAKDHEKIKVASQNEIVAGAQKL